MNMSIDNHITCVNMNKYKITSVLLFHIAIIALGIPSRTQQAGVRVDKEPLRSRDGYVASRCRPRIRDDVLGVLDAFDRDDAVLLRPTPVQTAQVGIRLDATRRLVPANQRHGCALLICSCEGSRWSQSRVNFQQTSQLPVPWLAISPENLHRTESVITGTQRDNVRWATVQMNKQTDVSAETYSNAASP